MCFPLSNTFLKVWNVVLVLASFPAAAGRDVIMLMSKTSCVLKS